MLNILSWIKRKPKPTRLKLVLVEYSHANQLIKSDSRWRVAKEEDTNAAPRMVYLELLNI